jgi:hypothetical protein
MHDIDNSLTKFENQDLVIVICKHSKFSRINEVFQCLLKNYSHYYIYQKS